MHATRVSLDGEVYTYKVLKQNIRGIAQAKSFSIIKKERGSKAKGKNVKKNWRENWDFFGKKERNHVASNWACIVCECVSPIRCQCCCFLLSIPLFLSLLNFSFDPNPRLKIQQLEANPIFPLFYFS